jgi:hypothetical protein
MQRLAPLKWQGLALIQRILPRGLRAKFQPLEELSRLLHKPLLLAEVGLIRHNWQAFSKHCKAYRRRLIQRFNRLLALRAFRGGKSRRGVRLYLRSLSLLRRVLRYRERPSVN